MQEFFRSLLGRRYWMLAYASFAIGVALPFDLTGLSRFIPVWLCGLMFFTGLRVTLGALAGEVASRSGALRVGFIAVFKLIVLPSVCFAIAHVLGSPWALGVLLVTAMPAGLSSPAFTDVNGGNVALALWVVLVTSLGCAATVPLLLHGATVMGATATPVAWGHVGRQAGFIAFILVGPFAIAQAVRRLSPEIVERHTEKLSPIALCFLLAINFSATASSRDLWLATAPAELAAALAWVALGSSLALACGFAATYALPRADAIAFGTGAVYINNGLAIAFAMVFYGDDASVLLPAVLVVVPMLWLVTRVGRGFPDRVPAANPRALSGP